MSSVFDSDNHGRNITVSVSFGATREVAFLRADEDPRKATRVYLPQRNNSAFGMGHAANLHWKHGVNSLDSPSSLTVDDDQSCYINIMVRGRSSLLPLPSPVLLSKGDPRDVVTQSYSKLHRPASVDVGKTPQPSKKSSVREPLAATAVAAVSPDNNNDNNNNTRVKIFIPAWAMKHDPNSSNNNKS